MSLKITNISKSFDDIVVLDALNMEIQDGEFFAILGASGSGKTSLLRIIAGFEKPDTGQIIIDGQDYTNEPANTRPTAMVFQDYALFPHYNILDNISYGLMIRGVAKHERYAQAQTMINLMKLQGLETRKPHQLSGGQRQRVALARSLIFKPKILLLDEPLGALDAALRENMQQELKNLQKTLGIAFVFITHDQQEAMALADRIAIINQGKLEQVAKPDGIYHQPQTQYVAQFIDKANIFSKELLQSWQNGDYGQEFYSLRSEKIQINPQNTYDFIQDAVVESCLYQGNFYKIFAKINDTAINLKSSVAIPANIVIKIGFNRADLWGLSA